MAAQLPIDQAQERILTVDVEIPLGKTAINFRARRITNATAPNPQLRQDYGHANLLDTLYELLPDAVSAATPEMHKCMMLLSYISHHRSQFKLAYEMEGGYAGQKVTVKAFVRPTYEQKLNAKKWPYPLRRSDLPFAIIELQPEVAELFPVPRVDAVPLELLNCRVRK
uniref:PAZ domain-containing protein n=1 Tax=Panagrellus redivivus TaxID=6233 RepID=A0A7E4ZU39_PANRE